MIELLPCPFCGGEAYMTEGVNGYRMSDIFHGVECMDCRANIEMACMTAIEAAQAWNTRHERTCQMMDGQWDNGQCTWGTVCSECDAHLEHERGRHLNYCPNCGARVEGSE